MRLTFTEEQRMLRDAARRFLSENYDMERRRRIAESETGLDPEIWAQMAELGWLALPFGEESGGLGGGAVEVAILAEEMGRVALVEPWIATVILAGGLIEAQGTPKQRAELLAPLIEGRSHPALAHLESGMGEGLWPVAAKAERAGSGYRLTGAKSLVPGGAGADTLLVTARLGAELAVFVVPPDAAGLTLAPCKTVDGGRAVDLVLDRVELPERARLGHGDAAPALATCLDCASAALASDAVGAMAALLEATVAYTTERQQFGQPLAKFQALRHRMAEMAVKCEEARASALLATLSADAEETRRVRGVSGARAKVGRLSRQVAQEAVQLHGAMGVSEELPVGTWFRRLMAFEATLGTTTWHLSRYGEVVRRPEVMAESLLRPDADADPESLNLAMSAEEAAFRDEVRSFLDEALSEDLRRAERLNPTTGIRWRQQKWTIEAAAV